MRLGQLGISAAVVFGIVGLWWGREAYAQDAEDDRPSWELATVEGIQEYWVGNTKHSTANICYHTDDGCRWDSVRITADRWSQTNDALAALTARLGARGWEPVGLTAPSEGYRQAILMKRQRRN